MKDRKRFAVLGCGPAGLLAAHAIEQLGHHVDIMSVKLKSEIGGAQYVHDQIPGLCSREDRRDLRYIKRGTPEGYALKVYGEADVPTSWKIFEEGFHYAWSMQDIYDQLWNRYEPDIYDEDLSADSLNSLLREEYKAVFCSLPLNRLCLNTQHRFKAAKIWIRQLDSPPVWLPENTVLYSGDPLDAWYRASSIFGHASLEFKHRPDGEMAGSHLLHGVKPTAHDCNCWIHAAGLVQIGRFGRWKKGVLVHQAYEQAFTYINDRFGQVQTHAV